MEKGVRSEARGLTLLGEWFGDGNGRTALLYTSWRGFSVDFMLNGERIEQRALWEHTRQYAEDTCENWVMEIIK